MEVKIKRYKTLVFDCDGVILNSNQLKTDAFYQVALPFGEQAATEFVHYHTENGGISRYEKFAYFLEHIAPPINNNPSLETLLSQYAQYVTEGLLSCEVAAGLKELRALTPNSRWLIVSGGDQNELRDIFAQRGLLDLFDGGIFGSPDTKDVILARELASSNIQKPALFLGDSKYDYQAAIKANLDFVFLSDWTEVKRWEEWVEEKDIVIKRNISELFKLT